mmetsp:Transcript_15796/g.49006  ORF Transcript_15796/g.49006 Transcript_15796/m.49006 type:complete len:309 (-) Transcript_15796:350-1276(-)
MPRLLFHSQLLSLSHASGDSYDAAQFFVQPDGPTLQSEFCWHWAVSVMDSHLRVHVSVFVFHSHSGSAVHLVAESARNSQARTHLPLSGSHMVASLHSAMPMGSEPLTRMVLHAGTHWRSLRSYMHVGSASQAVGVTYFWPQSRWHEPVALLYVQRGFFWHCSLLSYSHLVQHDVESLFHMHMSASRHALSVRRPAHLDAHLPKKLSSQSLRSQSWTYGQRRRHSLRKASNSQISWPQHAVSVRIDEQSCQHVSVAFSHTHLRSELHESRSAYSMTQLSSQSNLMPSGLLYGPLRGLRWSRHTVMEAQ